jgi:S-formylglutathione hydrolase FrmB
MPDGGRSFYIDAVEGMAYETAIVRDLVGYVDRTFQTKAARESRCLAGLSMGGYGAAKLALKFPDLFCAAASHSGAMGFSHWQLNKDDAWGKEMLRIVGDAAAGGPNDLYTLSKAIEPEKRPALRIDCGTDDFLINDNRAFDGHLNEIGYDHIYTEYPGAHNWAYWDVHIQDTLAFLADKLGIGKSDTPG